MIHTMKTVMVAVEAAYKAGFISGTSNWCQAAAQALNEQDAAPSPELREIRLHFYKAALDSRRYAAMMERPGDAKHYNKRADLHMSRCQALNDLFPADDMVDADYRRAYPDES